MEKIELLVLSSFCRGVAETNSLDFGRYVSYNELTLTIKNVMDKDIIFSVFSINIKQSSRGIKVYSWVMLDFSLLIWVSSFLHSDSPISFQSFQWVFWPEQTAQVWIFPLCHRPSDLWVRIEASRKRRKSKMRFQDFIQFCRTSS